MRIKIQKATIGIITGLVAILLPASAYSADLIAPNSVYTELNLSAPMDSQPIHIQIQKDQSESLRLKARQEIKVAAYVERVNGSKAPLVDAEGKSAWSVVLNGNKEAELFIYPDASVFSGRLVVTINGKKLIGGSPKFSETFGKTLEKVYQWRFQDGATIKVHFTDQILEETSTDPYFPKEVLDAAVLAYQTITQFQGFSTAGYAFASPDESYAYDPDKTIDVFLGNPSETNFFPDHGFGAAAFKDAPCFDTLRISDTAFQAVILLPSNYRAFIKNWEKINPSSLGARNVNTDLRGTLIHEMLHVIIFYYNKNLNRGCALNTQGVINIEKVDWYVEGLARYFETLAGARHDFYSQGFKQTLPDKIRFSRGGSNYFMRYPDQAFTDLRYENALFWRFIDEQKGMKAIEWLSRNMRQMDRDNHQVALEQMSGMPMEELLKKFSTAILFKDFNLKEDEGYLKEIARTRLAYNARGFSLKDGYGREEFLGKRCQTDWIGSWENEKAALHAPPVAGDNTLGADVSGWATDFYQIDFSKNLNSLPWLGIKCKLSKIPAKPLAAQIILMTRGGSKISREISKIGRSQTQGIALDKVLEEEGLETRDIEKCYVLITNTDPKIGAKYELVAAQ